MLERPDWAAMGPASRLTRQAAPVSHKGTVSGDLLDDLAIRDMRPAGDRSAELRGLVDARGGCAVERWRLFGNGRLGVGAGKERQEHLVDDLVDDVTGDG